MRLLNTETLTLSQFFGKTPTYAILSHTWGPDEPTFQDMVAGRADERVGYHKIIRSSEIAARDGTSYIWIDTVCIDKTSSAELSEAINSMYHYYKTAKICYAYLEDVPSNAGAKENMVYSRWWSRGWTLQELLAPKYLAFYSKDWRLIETKLALAPLISQSTGIDEAVLSNSETIRSVSVAKRMSWAAKRETTRDEDIAYCLLGIFGVNMPLLYGEGLNAFTRLQEEIMKSNSDQSLFAWAQPRSNTDQMYVSHAQRTDFVASQRPGVLSPHPRHFFHSADVISFEASVEFGHGTDSYSITNKGLRIRLPIIQQRTKGFGVEYVAVLACRREGNLTGPIGFRLMHVQGSHGKAFTRHPQIKLEIIDADRMRRAKSRSVYILTNPSHDPKRARYLWLRKIPSQFEANFDLGLSDALILGRFACFGPWDKSTKIAAISPPNHHTQFHNCSTKIVFQEASRPDQRVFDIVLGIDRSDHFSAWVDLQIAGKFLRFEQGRVSNISHEPKRLAHVKMSLRRSLTAKLSWEMVMNSEVLILDISFCDSWGWALLGVLLDFPQTLVSQISTTIYNSGPLLQRHFRRHVSVLVFSLFLPALVASRWIHQHQDVGNIKYAKYDSRLLTCLGLWIQWSTGPQGHYSLVPGGPVTLKSWTTYLACAVHALGLASASFFIRYLVISDLPVASAINPLLGNGSSFISSTIWWRPELALFMFVVQWCFHALHPVGQQNKYRKFKPLKGRHLPLHITKSMSSGIHSEMSEKRAELLKPLDAKGYLSTKNVR